MMACVGKINISDGALLVLDGDRGGGWQKGDRKCLTRQMYSEKSRAAV